MKKLDLEAELFMLVLNLQEDKNKKYDGSFPKDYHITYVFENDEEYKEYFFNNGVYDEELIEYCKLKTTRKGTVLALKGICNHYINICNDYPKSKKNRHKNRR